jgi:F-type H+-transporting ATPase subunit b
MLIDWFTVIAQALNFLILLWLLKRFAYQPVLQAINSREQRIAAQVAAAVAAEAAATAERDALSRKGAEFDQHRAALLNQVNLEAQTTRAKLLEQARTDAEAQRTRLLGGLSAEQADLRRDLGNKVREEVLQITGKTLRDLAQVSLNESMVEVFLKRLGTLGEADRQLLGAAAGVEAGTPIVRSAFALDPETRGRVEAAVAALRGPHTGVEFATAPDLLCGIELQIAGRRLAWSVRDYLADLEAGIDEILTAHSTPARAAAAAAAVAPTSP